MRLSRAPRLVPGHPPSPVPAVETILMTMSLQIDELLALQAVDTAIGKLHQAREALDRGERIERALAIRQARLQQAEKRLHTLEVEQRTAELELKALEEKKHQESRRLYEGRITSPRELQALEMEIAMLERQRQRLDESILRRMEEIEGARRNVEAARASVEEAEKALRIVRKRYDRESARIEEELRRVLPERERLAEQIDRDVLRRYEEIRRRNHNLAAVRIENGACGGCRMKVGSALLRRVLAGDHYVYCESCSRFLFPPEPHAS